MGTGRQSGGESIETEGETFKYRNGERSKLGMERGKCKTEGGADRENEGG